VKKIIGLIVGVAVVIGLVASGTWAVFTDTETITNNTFTAGTIDISLNPTDGQAVATVSGDLDLKPCQVGYTRIIVTNDGTNPAEVWKHIANVVNDENDVVEPEQAFYTANSGSDAYLLSDWIHYDMSVGEAVKSTYNTDGKDVEADIVKTSACCTTTWVVDITSENVPHHKYGIGLLISDDGGDPDYNVWYAETGAIPAGFTETGWYYQAYPFGVTVQPVSELPWITVNDRTEDSKHFEVSIDCAHLGGAGATYYWNMQLRTNLISWVGDPGGFSGNMIENGALENHVPAAAVEVIPENEGFYLTQNGTYLPSNPTPKGEVECNWIYLRVLQPGESMAVCQSYHLDESVDNWGQSDKVTFDIEFMAQQIEGATPELPGDVLPGHGRQ
jgi:predicted ribosomally synthesized peptide with SipW-like signal peptide